MSADLSISIAKRILVECDDDHILRGISVGHLRDIIGELDHIRSENDRLRNEACIVEIDHTDYPVHEDVACLVDDLRNEVERLSRVHTADAIIARLRKKNVERIVAQESSNKTIIRLADENAKMREALEQCVDDWGIDGRNVCQETKDWVIGVLGETEGKP